MDRKFTILIRCLLPLCFLLIGSPLKALSSMNSSPPSSHQQERVVVKPPKTQGETPVQAQLISEDQTIQPGHPFWVGIELKMADGWDTYWINPGDVGFPTKVEWHLPDGFHAGPLHWPYPERFTSQSLVGYGYVHSVLLLSEITPPDHFSSKEPITLKADVSWLACKEQCVPGNAKIETTLPLSDQTPAPNALLIQDFAHARSLLPQSLKEKGALTLAAKKEDIVLNFKPTPGLFKEVVDALFIPEHGQVIDYGAPQHFANGDQGFTLTVKRASPDNSLPSQVKGVLLVSEKGSSIKKAIQIDSSVGTQKIAHGMSSFWVAVGFAFLGGIILNVMPCVLPVIALKIFGFVKIAHQRRLEILKHGGIFALGVLVCFWLLSGILLVLRAYGESFGWGFQLQEPLFVAVLTGILFLLGLSLFGVFELGTSLISLGQKGGLSTSKSPLGSSFMSGVLATLVATPCTGPLLGPALGFAMTLSATKALAVFSSMGLGMAFPYVLFSAFPSLVRCLPKPGNWMIIFKQLMGFLMMGTVVWLIWVFGAQTDHLAVFILLAALLIISIGAWIYGKWSVPTRRRSTRWTALIAACTLFFTAGWGVFHVAKRTPAQFPVAEMPMQQSEWIPYSPEKVAALRQEGKAVFVDFTAKWCLICQANKVVLHSSELTKAFHEKGVVTMMADWTKRDGVITEALQNLGRSGVPVYVLYPSDTSKDPYILPQTLTSTVVQDYLGKLNTTTVYAD